MSDAEIVQLAEEEQDQEHLETADAEENEEAYDEEAEEGEHHEEEEHAAEAAADEAGPNLDSNTLQEMSSISDEINVNSLSELNLDAKVIREAQGAWKMFLNQQSSLNAAGEVIYTALFDAAPSLQSLFITPRAVQAMRFMNGIHNFIMSLDDPPALKALVETLGFGHLVLAVTIPRIIIFRDAITDLLAVELGSKYSDTANNALKGLLNYIGGGIIFMKANYSERLRVLNESWALCNEDKKAKEQEAHKEREMEAGGGGGAKNVGKKGGKEHGGANEEGEGEQKTATESLAQNVPTTYKEMFQFNAAVMGFGNSIWMNEVLSCFDNIVVNVANSYRFIEECDILVLRISKLGVRPNLGEYKSCMLATLRSLLPKDWSTLHEVSWSWIWENIEKNLLKTLGSPPKWAAALGGFIGGLDENTAYEFRAAIYVKFFEQCPISQDYFKQSNTYLHMIAQKIIVFSLDIYLEPVRMTDDISALGLRHVGYAIPTELFAPLVTACVEVLKTSTSDDNIIEGFQWGMSLVAKMLVRTVLEGSTVVMKAINTNRKKDMNKAVACAPRGERMAWILTVTVGTQRISPLAWSLEAGALESASAMIADLLTIRADRDAYYYGMEEMFLRHPDIVKLLMDAAPGLIPELLDALIWRSRLTFNGMRRVNYYLKYLLIDTTGHLAPTLDWFASFNDPVIVTHPVLTILADLVWNRVACRTFFIRKSWFLLSLIVFIFSQSVLERGMGDALASEKRSLAIFALRVFIYVFSLGQMLLVHVGKIFKTVSKRDWLWLYNRIPVPKYWSNWQDLGNFILAVLLITMLSLEPMYRCLGAAEGDGDKHIFSDNCKDAVDLSEAYSFVVMICMFLYFVLLIDLAVLNNRVSAFVLVCQNMLSEMTLFLIGLLGVILTFSSSISCFRQTSLRTFNVLWLCFAHLLAMVINLTGGSEFLELRVEPVIIFLTWIFLITTVIFLLGVLIAQLSCAYDACYADMVGYARLKRIKIIIESMAMVSQKRFDGFVVSLGLDDKIEYNEGDTGLPGGIQQQEAATLHPTTIDMIYRFGGTTAVTAQWPQDDLDDDDTDRFERMERAIQRAIAAVGKKGGHKGRGGSGSGSAGRGISGSGSGEAGEGEEGSGEGSGGSSGEGAGDE